MKITVEHFDTKITIETADGMTIDKVWDDVLAPLLFAMGFSMESINSVNNNTHKCK